MDGDTFARRKSQIGSVDRTEGIRVGTKYGWRLSEERSVLLVRPSYNTIGRLMNKTVVQTSLTEDTQSDLSQDGSPSVTVVLQNPRRVKGGTRVGSLPSGLGPLYGRIKRDRSRSRSHGHSSITEGPGPRGTPTHSNCPFLKRARETRETSFPRSFLDVGAVIHVSVTPTFFVDQ